MSKKKVPNRIFLSENELPTHYYNLLADMPVKPAPYLHPATMKPVTYEDMVPVFAPELIKQEMDFNTRMVEIPEEVRDLYKMFRPSALHRAYHLEKALGTPARIYYKYEGTNTSGSHKLNTALPQVYYNKMAGIERLTTETGAGQWGTALAISAQFFNMPIDVYMVKVSAQQKPYRKAIMETYGANVIPSPSNLTESGRKILADDPDCSGSLGIAISEAVEAAVTGKNTRYVLGSVLNHVILHQSIIGLETKKQLEMVDEYPDIIVACTGGGSNFGGIVGPFMSDKLLKGTKTRFIAAEPAACPSFTKGKFAYDYSDTAQISPICKMYTLGHGFVPPGIHAGGLRYHGMSPALSLLYHDGYMEARAEKQTEVFEAATFFARHEAILPAPESSHAIRVAIDEALKCKETGEEKCILFLLSGHGNFDLSAYTQYNEGKMKDIEFTDAMLQKGLSTLPKISGEAE